MTTATRCYFRIPVKLRYSAVFLFCLELKKIKSIIKLQYIFYMLFQVRSNNIILYTASPIWRYGWSFNLHSDLLLYEVLRVINTNSNAITSRFLLRWVTIETTPSFHDLFLSVTILSYRKFICFVILKCFR